MAKTQNTGKDIEQEEFSLIAGGNAKKKMIQHFGLQFASSLQG